MTPARSAILRQAQSEAAMLRRCGYPDAQVLPEYCIASEIGPDKIMTSTICVYVGDYQEDAIPEVLRNAMKKDT